MKLGIERQFEVSRVQVRLRREGELHICDFLATDLWPWWAWNGWLSPVPPRLRLREERVL